MAFNMGHTYGMHQCRNNQKSTANAKYTRQHADPATIEIKTAMDVFLGQH
jgi:hypothetical protein